MNSYTAPAAPAYQATPTSKQFFATLFDFSFTSFIAPKLIKVLYALFVFFAVVLTIVAIAAAFNFHSGLGVLVLLASPIIFFVYVMLFRVGLELIQVFFAIERHTGQQLTLLRSGLPPVPPSEF